jgi:hypothetical protein
MEMLGGLGVVPLLKAQRPCWSALKKASASSPAHTCPGAAPNTHSTARPASQFTRQPLRRPPRASNSNGQHSQ